MLGTSHSLTRDDGPNEEASSLKQPRTVKYSELQPVEKRGSLWAKEFMRYYTEGLYFTRQGQERERHTFGRREDEDKEEAESTARNIVFMELQP